LIAGSPAEEIINAADKINELETQIEKAQSQRKQLSSERDLAWQAYQALEQKATEIKNAALTGTQVALASPAVEPEKPAARGTLQKTVIAATLGFFLAVSWVLLEVWWAGNETPGAPAADSP